MQYVGHIYCIIFPLLCNKGSSLNNTNSLTPSSVGRNSAHVTRVGPLPRVSQVAIKVLVRLHSFPQALGCIRSPSFESRSSVVRWRIWFPPWLLAVGCDQLLVVVQLLHCVRLLVTP